MMGIPIAFEKSVRIPLLIPLQFHETVPLSVCKEEKHSSRKACFNQGNGSIADKLCRALSAGKRVMWGRIHCTYIHKVYQPSGAYISSGTGGVIFTLYIMQTEWLRSRYMPTF